MEINPKLLAKCEAAQKVHEGTRFPTVPVVEPVIDGYNVYVNTGYFCMRVFVSNRENDPRDGDMMRMVNTVIDMDKKYTYTPSKIGFHVKEVLKQVDAAIAVLKAQTTKKDAVLKISLACAHNDYITLDSLMQIEKGNVVNAKYFKHILDAFNAADIDAFEIRFREDGDCDAPIEIAPLNDEKSVALLMPMRL